MLKDIIDLSIITNIYFLTSYKKMNLKNRVRINLKL